MFVIGAACRGSGAGLSWVAQTRIYACTGSSTDLDKVARVRIEYTRFDMIDRRTYVIEPQLDCGFASVRRSIDASLVDAVASAATSNLYPSDGMSSCVMSTDSSERFQITIEGTRAVELLSTSQCDGNAPWNVVREGTLFVQYDGSVAAPIYALLAAVDPERWKGGHPPRRVLPERLSLGSAPMDRREPAPAGVKLAPSRAAACARSMAASPQIRAALGDPVSIVHLAIGCDAVRDPACRRTEAQGTVTWRGIELMLPFACVDDVVDGPTFAAQFAAVKPFVESKVFAAWSAVALGRGFLAAELSGVWLLRGERAPDIRYYDQTRTLDVRVEDKTNDAPFWIALGIDPATRVNQGPGFQSHWVRLDLVGSLLPD